MVKRYRAFPIRWGMQCAWLITTKIRLNNGAEIGSTYLSLLSVACVIWQGQRAERRVDRGRISTLSPSGGPTGTECFTKLN